MEDLFKTIPKLIADENAPAELQEAVVLAAWKKAAGEALCDHTSAVSLQEGRLKVAVRDEVWKRHLESLSGQMIFKINSKLGSPAVTYIEFFVDSERISGTPRDPRESVREKAFRLEAERCRSDIPEVVLASIHDEELRELFREAAANCIARHNIMVDRGEIEPVVDFTIED